MDALMAALVAAMMAQASDRTPWLAARLAQQFAKPGLVIVGTVIALATSNAIGAALGAAIAPLLTPNARALLLSFALLSAGLAALWPPKPLPQPGGRTLGPILTAFIVLLASSMGDRTQFLTSAIAARGATPIFTAIGATLGSMAIHLPAIAAGEAARPRLPLTPIRLAIALVFLIAGAIAGLSALRLI